MFGSRAQEDFLMRSSDKSSFWETLISYLYRSQLGYTDLQTFEEYKEPLTNISYLAKTEDDNSLLEQLLEKVGIKISKEGLPKPPIFFS